MPPVIQPHPNTIRGPIEQTHNALRDARVKAHTDAITAENADFHADLAVLKTNKENALFAAGLNRDGSTPADYPEPQFIATPTITGTAQVGQTLTCVPTNPVGDDTLTYQWERDKVAIGGATASTRVLTGPDETHKMRCKVTATNEAGSNSAYTAETVAVIAA